MPIRCHNVDGCERPVECATAAHCAKVRVLYRCEAACQKGCKLERVPFELRSRECQMVRAQRSSMELWAEIKHLMGV